MKGIRLIIEGVENLMTLNMKEIKPGFQTLEEGEIQWLENVGTVWLE